MAVLTFLLQSISLLAAPTEPPVMVPTEPPQTAPTEPPQTAPTDPPQAAPTEPPQTTPTDPPIGGDCRAEGSRCAKGSSFCPGGSAFCCCEGLECASDSDFGFGSCAPAEPPTDPTDPPVVAPTETPTVVPTESPQASPTDPPQAEPLILPSEATAGLKEVIVLRAVPSALEVQLSAAVKDWSVPQTPTLGLAAAHLLLPKTNADMSRLNIELIVQHKQMRGRRRSL